MAKSTCASPVQLGFVGLCKAFSMYPKEVDAFANLCSSLEKINHFNLLPFLSWRLSQVNYLNIANFVVTPVTRQLGIPSMPMS
jgi:hypothetical protein